MEDDILDEAWNPRNKYLADERFFTDIKGNGCQNPGPDATWSGWCLLPSIAQAFVMQFGVRVVNSKLWPYTQYDLEHIDDNYQFAEYYIPSVDNIRVSKPSDRQFAVSWTYDPGTVRETTVSEYRLCWEKSVFGIAGKICEKTGGHVTSYTLGISRLSLASIRSFISVEIRPNNRLTTFGGSTYPLQEFDEEY